MGLAVTGAVWDGSDFDRIITDPVVKSLTKQDYLIILGGCGVTAPRRDLQEEIRRFRSLPCSVLFLDGAGDDYDLLADHPAYPWNGGLTQLVSRYIMRLCRGQVFELCGLRILTIGGASTEGRDDVGRYWDWWPDQDVTRSDADEAVRNSHGAVDVVLSCDCPSSWRGSVGCEGSEPSSDMLEIVRNSVGFDHWLFGNYAVDADISPKVSCIYRRVVRLA